MDEFYQRKQAAVEARQDFERKLNYILSSSIVTKKKFSARVRFLNLTILIFIATLAISSLYFTSIYVKAKPIYNQENQGLNEKFVIDIGKKIVDFDKNSIKLEPDISGSWSLKRGNFIESDKLLFTPRDNFLPNTLYKINEIKLYNWISGQDIIKDLSFTTEPAIGLKHSGLISLDDNSVIPADYEFEVSLRYKRDVEIKTTPELDLVKRINNNDIYWRAKQRMPQGSNIKIDIWDISINKIIYSKILLISPSPNFNINKDHNLVPGDELLVTFSEPISNINEKLIDFDAKGQGSWISETKYSYKLTEISPGTSYKYILKSGIRTKRGGLLEKDFVGEISTVGPVTVLSSSPQGNGLSQASQTISFSFDQSVEKSSAENNFHINTGNIESKYWQGNTLYVKVNNLGYQKNVVALIDPGIKNSGFGLPSTQTYTVSFSTETRVTKYNIPFYRQQYKASCAAASLRMIMAFKGIKTNDLDIVYRMGYNPRSIDKSTDPPTWDDPDQMFVGDINGSIGSGTAAGPDALPIVAAAQSYGRSSYRALNINTSWVADQLFNGRLVVGFGATGNSKQYIQWKTPNGRIEKMNIRSHAVAISGFMGESNAPIGFWVNDPLSNGIQYWSNSQLQAYIDLDPYKQAVAVQ